MGKKRKVSQEWRSGAIESKRQRLRRNVCNIEASKGSGESGSGISKRLTSTGQSSQRSRTAELLLNQCQPCSCIVTRCDSDVTKTKNCKGKGSNTKPVASSSKSVRNNARKAHNCSRNVSVKSKVSKKNIPNKKAKKSGKTKVSIKKTAGTKNKKVYTQKVKTGTSKKNVHAKNTREKKKSKNKNKSKGKTRHSKETSSSHKKRVSSAKKKVAVTKRTYRKKIKIQAAENDSISGSMAKIPDEIWVKIMSFLPTWEKMKCRGISRKFYHLVSDPVMWYHLDLSGRCYGRDRSYQAVRLLGSRFTHSLTLEGSYGEEQCSSSSTTGLGYSTKRGVTVSRGLIKLVKRHCPSLTRLSLIHCRVGCYMPPVKRLTLDSCCKSISFMSYFRQPLLQQMLEELTIVSDGSDKCCPISPLVFAIQDPERAQSVSFQRLHTLRHIYKDRRDPFNKPSYWRKLQIIVSKTPYLRSLCLVCCEGCEGRRGMGRWLEEQNVANGTRINLCKGCDYCQGERARRPVKLLPIIN